MKRVSLGFGIVLLAIIGVAGILNAAQQPPLTQTEVLRQDLSVGA